MITVPEATKNIISRSRYLTEAISKGIINNSSLARYIKPEIEEMIKKSASMPSIIAAINRVSSTIKPKYIKSDIFKSSPEMILRSNLTLLSLANSSSLEEKYDSLLKLPNSRHFLSLTKGSFETSMVISDELIKKVKDILKNEKITLEIGKVSSITILLPKDSTKTPGIFYFFLKSLAWEGINILEIVSTQSELTLVVDNKDVNRTYFVLNALFSGMI